MHPSSTGSLRLASPPTAQSPTRRQLPPQPKSQVRRVTSFAQRLRGGSARRDGFDHDGGEKVASSRPYAVYVPTHAAASFARTTASSSSSLSPVPVPLPSSLHKHDRNQIQNQTQAQTQNQKHSQIQIQNHIIHQPNHTEYAAFLSKAKASERASRTRIALRARESPPPCCRRPSSTTTTRRDSAYYSDSSTTSTGRDVLAPLAPIRSQPRTLGRRLSEYFKPPLEAARVGAY